MKTMVTAVLFLALSVSAADQAELWMNEGLKLLKEKPDTSLVQAAGLFAKAADAYEAKGDQTKAAEANSCLYWTRKKFTVRETGIIVQNNPVAAKRIEKIVAEKPKEEEAKGYLERADAFAKDSKNPLLIAIRYFEVADRFPSTEQGRRAMDASLKAMQNINLAVAKPVLKDATANIDPAVNKQWFIIGHSGGWGEYVITETKLKVIAADGKVSIENTENFADMTVLLKILLAKDFICRMRVSIENGSHVKFSDKENSCLYADLPRGRSEVILKREGGKLSILINNRKVEVMSYLNGKHNMSGYVGFELRTGNKIELISCEIQEK